MFLKIIFRLLIQDFYSYYINFIIRFIILIFLILLDFGYKSIPKQNKKNNSCLNFFSRNLIYFLFSIVFWNFFFWYLYFLKIYSRELNNLFLFLSILLESSIIDSRLTCFICPWIEISGLVVLFWTVSSISISDTSSISGSEIESDWIQIKYNLYQIINTISVEISELAVELQQIKNSIILLKKLKKKNQDYNSTKIQTSICWLDKRIIEKKTEDQFNHLVRYTERLILEKSSSNQNNINKVIQSFPHISSSRKKRCRIGFEV